MRNNTDPRSKCWLPLIAFTVVVGVAFPEASVAAEAEAIGEPIPSGTEPSSVPTELSIPKPANWQSLSFGVPNKRIADTLSKGPSSEETVLTRGAVERSLYEKAAPSVVLVMTDDGFGSGSYLGSNQIITNWHVVKGASKVAVIFWDRETAFRAIVGKVDQTRDLALLSVDFIPESISPLKLGYNAAVKVGDDVHAIGHPQGETWTYTKGFVSAVRPDYRWEADGNSYSATVIQTQTPINPGNSGGPLLNDDAEILGVNTVGRAAAQGLNYAVSADDVRMFLKSAASTPSAKIESEGRSPSAKIPDRLCESRQVYEGKGRVRGANGWLIQYDTNCDGRVDFSYFYPKKKSRSYLVLIDTNSDGKNDIEIQDRNRDRKWDISYHDTNHDGRPDLVGRHPDGKLQPSYYDRYAGS